MQQNSYFVNKKRKLSAKEQDVLLLSQLLGGSHFRE